MRGATSPLHNYVYTGTLNATPKTENKITNIHIEYIFVKRLS